MSQRDELPLNPQVSLQDFDKWAIDFVGTIQPPRKKIGACNIITVIEYLTKWVKEKPVKDYSAATTTKFIFEYILSRLGFPNILMIDRGSHFLNEMIVSFLEEFKMYHQKSMPDHTQANGIVEAFNKILENSLMKICNVNMNDWDVHIPIVIWAYRTAYKKLTGQTPFRLVYGQEVVMPMD